MPIGDNRHGVCRVGHGENLETHLIVVRFGTMTSANQGDEGAQQKVCDIFRQETETPEDVDIHFDDLRIEILRTATEDEIGFQWVNPAHV